MGTSPRDPGDKPKPLPNWGAKREPPPPPNDPPANRPKPPLALSGTGMDAPEADLHVGQPENPSLQSPPADWKQKLLANKPLAGGIAGALVLLLIVGIWAIVGGRGEESDEDEDDEPTVAAQKDAGGKKKKSASAVYTGTPLEPPEIKTIPCRIYTPEPGFFVLIDGEPARSDDGKKLRTPCEVGVAEGNRTIMVVREKYKDASEIALISRPREFEFSPSYEPFEQKTGYFASRFTLAELGKPVALSSVNTGGPVRDPFLSSDGLTLWFAGELEEGKGLYFSRRETTFDEFGPPQLIKRTAEWPAGISVTDDRRLIAYTFPGKAQIRALLRESNDGEFTQGADLQFTDKEGEKWLSAWISGDAKSLFCVQQRAQKTATYVLTRKDRDKKFTGKWKRIALPGTHPCLSLDGLRQYQFDGEKILRSSRKNAQAEFSEPEVVAAVELKNYIPRETFRQYFVTDDEQWLFYTDDPERGGNLYAVRIADGPGWGYAPRGRSIEQKEIRVAGTEPDNPDEPEMKKPEQPPPPDPRGQPLPYADLRRQLDERLAAFDFSAAEKLIAEARKDPKFDADKEVLAWDMEDLGRAQAFWKKLEAAVVKLKPGEPLRAGPIQIEFVKYEDGVVSGKVRGSGKEASRPLVEFGPTELAGIVDKTIDRADESAQMEVAAFLALSQKVSTATVNARLDKSGVGGRLFVERQGQRKLHLVDQEIARDNIGIALQLIDQLVAANPKSETATKALALKDGLYSRIEWRQLGRQRWQKGSLGEYAAIGTRVPNAHLLSSREYGNFLLTMEWKSVQDTSQGGVYFHYKGSNELRGNAPKIHLANDFSIRNQPDKFSTGSLFSETAPKVNAVKKSGDWNTFSLRVEGDRVVVHINGQEVLDVKAGESGAKGYIALDGEVPGIVYRKIVVYELVRSPTGKSPGKK